MRTLVLLISLLLLPGLSAANSGEKKADESAGPVIEYLEMKPAFTVNLAEPKKYLLLNVQLLVEGAEPVEKIKKHMPLLRHEMIMMLSGLHAADLQTMEQREGLRLKTKEMITGLLTKIQNPDGFRDVFFSEFLIQ
ncbi:flagellar basal body-associated FliL family protein [Methylomonas sp. MED-D]|uniref:Flagellar protein FliL n=2 Tax=Methylomonas TaxID=416 RepID=A0A177NDJ0_9GAMM|nr:MULTISPECIES: flagellar basal body-associated FliL family protein [Methylomonas]NJA05105.1 flagellar basal body-associated FliL family protein [Methylococcaceae bacterium WWC4]MDT4331699.1 flagellar basal body-associated FliL family protein [Methylomonas sp. MV1]OAI15975.1 flagellar basal body protein FliL [Methylomonas koyamae]OHX36363.1 flagellar basal body protein FliL [Methylomonas sp. LWB]WGS84163.1 flagellar basal body-associated FliL family protein [Methylomonas sp. UP202]